MNPFAGHVFNLYYTNLRFHEIKGSLEGFQVRERSVSAQYEVLGLVWQAVSGGRIEG
jgi:hypothetical protein